MPEQTEIIDAEVVEQKSIVRVQPTPVMLQPIMPVMDLAMAKARLAEFQEFVKFYLKEEEDFGTIPGTPKPTLYKAGADKLCELYGLADTYEVIASTVNWDTGLFDYEIRCILTSRRDRGIVATGLGCCSSFESRYRWREGKRKCPGCESEAIIKGKKEFGGGWLCWKKKGGCGQKFADGDKSIEGQDVARIPNPDICDLKNTIIKMAKKRAKVDATLAATRSSGVFTQDMDDVVRTEEVPEASHDVYEATVEATPESEKRIEFKDAKKFWDAVKKTGKTPAMVSAKLVDFKVTQVEKLTRHNFDLAMAWAISKAPEAANMEPALKKSVEAVKAAKESVANAHDFPIEFEDVQA